MNLGPFEIIVILVVALVIFGPKNLPKLGKAMGETVKNVREGMEGDDEPAAEESKMTKVVADTTAPTSESTHFCIHCGAPLPADAEFCSKCGKPQTPEATTPTEPTDEATAEAPVTDEATAGTEAVA